MIPTRTLTATLEISTGSMIITNRPPAFTGEADALNVNISMLDGGVAYSPIGNVFAQLYLYWAGTIDMSEAVDLTITGSTLTGALPDTLTAVPGCPLMVIQLTDADTGALIVAAATPVQITNVLGERVISSRPATPSEIVYIGRSPYIDTTTGHWMQWDTATQDYTDTGVSAAGRPASFSATATSLPAGSAPTASITGTPDAPVVNLGIPIGDTGATGPTGQTGAAAGFGTPTASVDANVGTPSVTVTASGPDTAKRFDFQFHNLKGEKGDTGGVSSVNGQTGAVQLNDEHIPSSVVSGQTTVEGALSSLSQQIENVESGIAIIVNGDTATQAVPVDGYAYIKNNTHELSEGLYKNISGSAFPVSGGTADSTVFQAVSNGGFNALNSLIPASVPMTHFVPSYPAGISDHDGGCFYAVYGNVVYLRISFKITGNREAEIVVAFNHNIPAQYSPSVTSSVVITDGTVRGTNNLSITPYVFRLYPKLASGTEYFIGVISYII